MVKYELVPKRIARIKDDITMFNLRKEINLKKMLGEYLKEKDDKG
jgi:hypothetical protein